MEIYQEKYLPVDEDCLALQAIAPCDLFMRVLNGKFALFAKKGLHLDKRAIAQSDVFAQQRLFIRNEEVHSYYAALKSRLFDLVNNPQVSAMHKVKAVHTASRDILKRVFYDPVVSVIHEACDIIHATTHLVNNDPSATALLMKLTEHHSATFIHCTNVGIFSTALARHYYGQGFSEEFEHIAPAFYFHDIGKFSVPPEILNKPGPLDEKERAIIRLHPEKGCKILEEANCLPGESYVIPLQHHERDDGTGYPAGLHGKDIHPFARICRMADIFEALTSERSYRKGLTAFEALKIMRSELSDLDKEFFESFVKLFTPH